MTLGFCDVAVALVVQIRQRSGGVEPLQEVPLL
jgi:hypothetical protein